MQNSIFNEIKVSDQMARAIGDMGFEELTPIQKLSIPPILEGKDIIAQAQTGTGKTCAFGIPIVENISEDDGQIKVLVLCPTRELAIQSSEEFKSISRYKNNIRILPIYGGQPIDRQIKGLKKRPNIIIGTPGRVMDHMRRRTLKFHNIETIVLDEADEMLNMGFREDIDYILKQVPAGRQTLLFSATMPKEILDLTSRYQKDPLFIKATTTDLTVPAIEQFYLEVTHSSKIEVMSRIIDTENIKLSLVFCNTKRRVDEVAQTLQSRGYAAEALHGDMKQEQRDRVMARFRKGLLDILVATDVAARGIDVDDINAVFNYDIPEDLEYYVHRIGRTGRAGRSGKAYSLVVGRDIFQLKDIQKYAKSTISFMSPPTIMDVEEKKAVILLNQLKASLNEGDYKKYMPYVEKFLQEVELNKSDITSLDVSAALLCLLSAGNGFKPVHMPEIDNLPVRSQRGTLDSLQPAYPKYSKRAPYRRKSKTRSFGPKQKGR